MAAGDYCTLAELKDWIGGAASSVTSDDLNFGNVITSVSRWIDNDCDRQFWATAAGVTRTFDTCDPCILDLGTFDDLSAVTAVVTDDDGDGVYENSWAASDYQATPVGAPTGPPEPKPYRSIKAVGTRQFPRHQRREGLIQVTGTWGWPAVPAAIRQACLIQAHRIFKRKDAPEGMMGFADFGVVRMQGRLDPDVAALITPYKLTAVLVA